jgi:hypothetical protein
VGSATLLDENKRKNESKKKGKAVTPRSDIGVYWMCVRVCVLCALLFLVGRRYLRTTCDGQVTKDKKKDQA